MMNNARTFAAVLTACWLGSVAALAADPAASASASVSGPLSWRAQTLGEALLYVLLFAVVGIITAVAGYKVFDRFTPGNLHQEIFEKQNMAAAILAAAVVVGLCLIIAASIIG